MAAKMVGDALRQRRRNAGLSQRQLAKSSGVAQPNIAAYESSRRTPTAATMARLEDALSVPTFARVRAVRDSILEAATRRCLSDVRVFGSVARGQARAGSDIDLLVHPGPEASLFDLAGFMTEMEELLGAGVDVVSDRGTGTVMDRIRAEAVAL